jgi:hypothetical protein
MPTRRTHIAAVPRWIATPVESVDKGLTLLHAAVAKVSHRGFDVRVPEEIHNLFQRYTALVQRGRVASPEGVEGPLLTLLAICLAAGPAGRRPFIVSPFSAWVVRRFSFSINSCGQQMFRATDMHLLLHYEGSLPELGVDCAIARPAN